MELSPTSLNKFNHKNSSHPYLWKPTQGLNSLQPNVKVELPPFFHTKSDIMSSLIISTNEIIWWIYDVDDLLDIIIIQWKN